MLHFCGAALKFPWRSLLTPHLLALQDYQTQPECLLWPHSALLLCVQKSVSCTERNKSERLFKVTGSHVHWENGNISEMAQHIHVVAADHWQEMSYACWIVPFLMTRHLLQCNSTNVCNNSHGFNWHARSLGDNWSRPHVRIVHWQSHAAFCQITLTSCYSSNYILNVMMLIIFRVFWYYGAISLFCCVLLAASSATRFPDKDLA